MTKAGIDRKLRHARTRLRANEAVQSQKPPSQKPAKVGWKKSRRVGRKQGAAGVTYLVSDRRVLAVAIREEIDLTFGGNLSEAARHVGLSQSTLNRLVLLKSARITSGTVARLRDLLPRNRSAWGSAIVTKNAQESLVAYTQWLRHWTPRGLAKTDPGAASSHRPWTRRPAEGTLQFLALVERARTLDPEIFEGLDALATMRHFAARRVAIVLPRILEPLLDFFEAGGIERHADELSDDELKEFVRAGMKRELILLNRDADLLRAEVAHEVATRVQLRPPKDSSRKDLRPRQGIADGIGDVLQSLAQARYQSGLSSRGKRALL